MPSIGLPHKFLIIAVLTCMVNSDRHDDNEFASTLQNAIAKKRRAARQLNETMLAVANLSADFRNANRSIMDISKSVESMNVTIWSEILQLRSIIDNPLTAAPRSFSNISISRHQSNATDMRIYDVIARFQEFYNDTKVQQEKVETRHHSQQRQLLDIEQNLTSLTLQMLQCNKSIGQVYQNELVQLKADINDVITAANIEKLNKNASIDQLTGTLIALRQHVKKDSLKHNVTISNISSEVSRLHNAHLDIVTNLHDVTILYSNVSNLTMALMTNIDAWFSKIQLNFVNTTEFTMVQAQYHEHFKEIDHQLVGYLNNLVKEYLNSSYSNKRILDRHIGLLRHIQHNRRLRAEAINARLELLTTQRAYRWNHTSDMVLRNELAIHQLNSQVLVHDSAQAHQKDKLRTLTMGLCVLGGGILTLALALVVDHRRLERRIEHHIRQQEKKDLVRQLLQIDNDTPFPVTTCKSS